MSGSVNTPSITYHVTALEMPIYFNDVRLDVKATCKGDRTEGNEADIVGGDHDHNGLMYALTVNVPILTYLRTLIDGETPTPAEATAAEHRAAELRLPPLPKTTTEARLPHPLIRPLVLRARHKETVCIEFRNDIRGRRVGMHLVGDGYDVKTSDGSRVGRNPSSLARTGEGIHYEWVCHNEGVFVFHDGGNYDGLEENNEDPDNTDGHMGSTNLHGLFGALAVEPEGAIWRDPVTGLRSDDSSTGSGPSVELDGLYMDILFAGNPPHTPAAPWPPPVEYTNFATTAHREYVIVFHDEPEFVPPHRPPGSEPLRDPCRDCDAIGHGGHGGHGDAPPIMPVSYRAEPMVNREHELFRLLCNTPKHDFRDRPVLNEEQHHSSWMFGDPATPILKAYIGDPVRIRLVHGGVMETHVFHLHLYEWHAAPRDLDSPRIDAISFSPQTGHTIEPLWGAGNRHQVAGDVIWHCHLYPHFHEGMWGMFRTFETLQDPQKDANGQYVPGDLIDQQDPAYTGRRIGQYPDGTPIERLLPLPGRPLPPTPTSTHPGFPLFIPGVCRQKSPVPPWPTPNVPLPADIADYDYRPHPTALEINAFNEHPVPGELFTRRPSQKQQDEQWQTEKWTEGTFTPAQIEEGGFIDNGPKEMAYEVGVTNRPVVYNDDNWNDPNGHFYYLKVHGRPPEGPQQQEPLFFRARHGTILNLTLENLTDPQFPEDRFDHALPPCATRPWEGECAMHVHMVKFDPICADGASTGWNYMSGATHGQKMVYRWWLDQEFGTIFFHDHLFANYRQKRGLFAALIVEPAGSTFLSNFNDTSLVSGLQARIVRHPNDKKGPPSFREFCLALADFIPLYDALSEPRNALNPPHTPGGHGDQGVMAINYRNEPILLRSRNASNLPDPSESADPSRWFSSLTHGDPATTGFATHAGDPIWFRLIQGSHEEQHSFQIHGMRWRRFRVNTGSALRNQQTFGLSEAFTFIHDERYTVGDYLYKLSGADDLWLGCWGLIRAFARSGSDTGDEGSSAAEQTHVAGPSVLPRQPERIPLPAPLPTVVSAAPSPATQIRRFDIEAIERRLVYRRKNGAHEADIVDPFGLVYRVTAAANPGEEMKPVPQSTKIEPLVIRCREGEIVEVTLFNAISPPGNLAVEPHAPAVPLDSPERRVSQRVSLHADLVLYDVQTSDGSFVGLNSDQTVPPGGSITYRWHTDRRAHDNGNEPLGPVLLQDMADFRHHRHHGLVGALVVEPKGAVPQTVRKGKATAAPGAREAWYGARATITVDGSSFEEMVLLMQDGLRLYWNGDTRQPLPDPPDEAGMPDHEDQGQKGFSYGAEPRGPLFDTRGRPDLPPHRWLHDSTPATPLWYVRAGTPVVLHLVGACDKPRNHSFTIHGVAWPEDRFDQDHPGFNVSSESAVTAGTVRTFRFTPHFSGDHAYRSGLLRWDVSQGMWGILRVVPQDGTHTLAPKALWLPLVLGLGWLVFRRIKKNRECGTLDDQPTQHHSRTKSRLDLPSLNVARRRDPLVLP